MKWKAKLPRLLVLALLLLPATGCRQANTLASVPANGVVLAFGDSLTFGTGAQTAESYPAVLATLIGRRVVNAGVPGEVSARGRERLAVVLQETHPDLLILCLGGNDFLQRLDSEQLRDNLAAMVREARAAGSQVVLMAVPKLGFGLQVPRPYGEIAKQERIPLEDEIIEEILTTSDLKSDPIHPNAAGYRRIAETLAALLQRQGAI